MKKTKVFLISFNQLTTEFWKQHLNFKNSQLRHWKNPTQGINNLSTVWPDVIIVDGYFAKESYEACLIKVIGLKSSSKIFCLTPLAKSHVKDVFIDERLFISKLNVEVINKINEVINP